ncbi:MAG: hypothetical protein OK454_00025, partial [Thaumarchaeota archaeon]|nr:hypothetical protein [Nitrososphaerota archaeon]
MNREEARTLLRQCQLDRSDAIEAAKVAAATVESTRLIIEGILKRYPDLSEEEQEWGEMPGENEEQPRGDKAILAVLQEYEDHLFPVGDMVVTLVSKGWINETPNSGNAVRSALERLRSSTPGVDKVRTGKGMAYRYSEP